MRLVVTGVETITITDPQGLIEAEKVAGILTADPLEALKARPGILPGTRAKPQGPPFTPFPDILNPPPPTPGPYTTPADPLGPRPYIGDPLINPIRLPGHTPAEPKRVPWAQWGHLTGDGDKWSCGLRAATEQEW